MDGKIEPVIGVIGHPVAGNPTQFAIENGLDHVKADCRVLSFDLPDDRLAAALAGMQAMDFRGVWVDATCRRYVSQWLSDHPTFLDQPGDPAPDPLQSVAVEALRQNPAGDGNWQSLQRRDASWQKMVLDQLTIGGYSIEQVLLIGHDSSIRRKCVATLQRESGLLSQEPAVDSAAESNSNVQAAADDEIQQLAEQKTDNQKIVLADHVDDIPADIRANVWVALEGVDASVVDGFRQSVRPPETVLVDLSESWDPQDIAIWDQCKMEAGPNCITRVDLHAVCLASIAKWWLGCDIPVDVLREAMEEYLSV